MSSILPKFDKGTEAKQTSVSSVVEHQAGSSITHGNTTTATVTSNVSSPCTNTTTSFYRGVNGSQQTIFSPIIAPQNQNYYNGVYCGQPGYANSSSVSSPNFNAFSYDSTPWTHEGHLTMHSGSLSAENMRNLTVPFSEKSVLNYSNTSHTCCISKLGSSDGPSLSSSLTTGVYKTSGKEMEQHNKIGINPDSQICFMNLSQQTPNSSLSMYKCPEQVSPSSFSQMNLYSLESCDFKYSSELPSLTNSTGEVVQKNSRSQPNVGKQIPSKYCHIPKVSSGESQAYDQLPLLDLKQQEQCAYSGQTSTYSSESHLETYYLQGPFPFNVESNQTHYASQRHANGHEESIYLSSKTFPSPSLDSQVSIGARTICHSDRPRSILDPSISADLVRLDGYLHMDPKLMASPCNQDNYHNGKQCDHDFQQQPSLNVTHHMVGPQFSQQSNCIQSCGGVKVNRRTCDEDSADCEILDSVNGKDIDVLESEDSSSQESLSIAEEDDIIVEEEVEEPKDKHSSMNEDKEKVVSSELKGCSSRCLVCDTFQAPSLQAFILIPLKADSPVTSVSCLPVITKLNHILLRKYKSTGDGNFGDAHGEVTFKNFHGEYLCGRCLSLVERADDLEVKLGMIYQDLQCLYKKTNSFRKGNNEINSESSEIVKKHNYPDKVSMLNDHAHVEKDDTCLKSSDENSASRDNESGLESKVVELQNASVKNFDLNANIKTVPLSDNVIESDEVKRIEEEMEDVANLDQKVEQTSPDQIQKENVENDREKGGAEDKKFVCDICDMRFSRKESVVKHMQLHTGDFSYRCEHCKKGFSRHGALARHLISRHNDGKDRHLFQCEQCGKRFTQEHHLQVHLQSHRGELPHSCQLCGKGFASRHSLSIHKRTHTGERPFSCISCGRPFSTHSNLRAHIVICPKNDAVKEAKLPKPLRHHCSFCEKGFAKPSDLKVHLRSHTGEKPFVCERCGKRFCNSGNYNQHARSHCNAASFLCKEEERVTKNKAVDEAAGISEVEALGMKAPKEKVDKSRPFKCKVCAKGFSRKGALVAHENRHKGIKPFACEVCGKAFPDRSNLHNHKLLHSSVKPHQCNVCGKSFRSSLKVHMRIHTGERPYSCSKCSQRFAVNSSLTAHVKKHHEGKVKKDLPP